MRQKIKWKFWINNSIELSPELEKVFQKLAVRIPQIFIDKGVLKIYQNEYPGLFGLSYIQPFPNDYDVIAILDNKKRIKLTGEFRTVVFTKIWDASLEAHSTKNPKVTLEL